MVEPEPVGGGQAGSAAQQIWSLPGSLPHHLPHHGDGWRHEGGLELQPLQQADLHQPDTHHQGQFSLSSCTVSRKKMTVFLKVIGDAKCQLR